MIRSMTGYGRAVMTGEDSLQVVVEISSVNRKNLDISVSMPREWQRLEPAIGDVIKKHVDRGRLNVSISVETMGGGEGPVFNAREVEKALVELAGLSDKLKVPFEPDLSLLLNIATAIRSKTSLPEPESVETGLLKTLGEAAQEMVSMRIKEGDAMRRDLVARNQELRNQLEQIRNATTGIVPDYRETLLKRLRQSGLEFVLDDERVLKEIAIFADRCDISEELTRLESHLAQFDEFIESREPVGRKLEFLIQEIGREFNTIGSKASASAISRAVIECKNELERIREQVQNVE